MAQVHPIDELAQRLWEQLERDVEFVQAQLSGPTQVGTRKFSAREHARRLMQMAPDQMLRLLSSQPEESPIASTALERLGAHGLALLPYLQPNPSEADPLSSGQQEVI